MKISHGSALYLESLVRRIWNLADRSHLHGQIDADCFEHAPYQSAVLILAPYVMHDCSIDRDPFVHTTMEELYCLCSEDEHSLDTETAIIKKAADLSAYLAEHYIPAK